MEPPDRVAERGLVRCALGLLGLLSFLAEARPASAQAWVPPAGVVIVSVVYQDINNTNHRLTDGSLFDGYDSRSRGVLLSVDYAITDRLSFSVGLPYLGAKYTGPEPSLFALPVDDCFCWSHGWQDVSATVRYNVSNGAFALTPSVSVGVPSHAYDYFGEAVLGRNLNEVRVAIDVGRRMDAISDKLSISGRYSYALVEKVLDLPNNRSNMALETGFQANRRLATRLGFTWQRSHGGLRSTEFTTVEEYEQYDRIIRDNHFHIAGGAAYSFPRFDVFASYLHYVSGTDTHAGRVITTGISWPFETR